MPVLLVTPIMITIYLYRNAMKFKKKIFLNRFKDAI